MKNVRNLETNAGNPMKHVVILGNHKNNFVYLMKKNGKSCDETRKSYEKCCKSDGHKGNPMNNAATTSEIL